MNPIEEKHDELIPSEPIGEHLAEKHATITKETAVGFYRWMHENCSPTDRMDIWEYYPGEATILKLTDSELYDIYVESLKTGTVENS